MKKAIVLLVLLSLLTSGLFAQAASETQQKVVLKWGSVHTPTSITTQLMNRVIENVKLKTDGRVEIQGYPSGALGGSRDLVEGVMTGMVDIVTEGPAQFSSWIPLASIAEAPYIWRDRDHMHKAMNGSFGDTLNKEFVAKNVRILGSFYYGTRQLTTTKAPINSVADMQGMKIRVPESDLYLEMVKAWGARPTPISFNELYLALQQNVADGQENPLTTFDGSKFYEVQKYVILTDHIICPNMILINENVWGKISEADRKVIDAVVMEAIDWHDAQVIKMENDLLDSFKARGVTVIRPDVESFRKVTVPHVLPKFEAKWGKGTWESIQAIK